MKKSILIVDDDDLTAIQLEGVLGEFFTITHAINGGEGIELACAAAFDLILLDVEMPDVDGYTVCRELKAIAATSHVPVIFISGHAETEDRLCGYDAGGDDYVAKPLVPVELRRKVGVVLRNQQKNAELAAQAKISSSAAVAAMTTAGDAERILHFLNEIVGFTGFAAIIEASFQILREYGLDTSVQLRAHNGTLSRNHAGYCSPLEESVLVRMSSGGRVVELGQRSAFNFPHVSIVVNNMPRGADEHARFRDIVSMIGEAVDIHMSSLDLTLKAIERGDTLLGLLHRNAATLREIETRHNEQRQKSADILENLVSEIEDSFYFMGLTENQELHLQRLARDAVERANAVHAEAVQTDAIMKSLGAGLDATLRQELQGAAEASADENRIELF